MILLSLIFLLQNSFAIPQSEKSKKLEGFLGSGPRIGIKKKDAPPVESQLPEPPPFDPEPEPEQEQGAPPIPKPSPKSDLSDLEYVPPEKAKKEVKKIKLEALKEEAKFLVYPIHATPRTLNSFSIGYSQGISYGILRLQFHEGEYDVLEDLLPPLKKVLYLKPRFGGGIVGTQNGNFSFFLSMENRLKLQKYGVGFKILAEVDPQEFKSLVFNGYVSSYAFKNFFVGSEGFLSLYVGFNSPMIQIDQKIGKLVGYARSLLFSSENIVAGIYYNPTVSKNLSFGVESNGKDFASFSIYTRF